MSSTIHFGTDATLTFQHGFSGDVEFTVTVINVNNTPRETTALDLGRMLPNEIHIIYPIPDYVHCAYLPEFDKLPLPPPSPPKFPPLPPYRLQPQRRGPTRAQRHLMRPNCRGGCR